MSAPELSPTREVIARCAYLIYEREGRPEGRALDHWLEAEMQLRANFSTNEWKRQQGQPRPITTAKKMGRGLLLDNASVQGD